MPRSRFRRPALAALASLIALSFDLTLLPAVSTADDTGTLTVVGTSDVYDSNLVQSVLKPGFEAAYPQYHLNYVSKGTGAAITYAEAGTASAMIVHAASLENQFVADGYSAERFGRAIFWGDFVLLGPKSDPAGVLTSSTHDIVGAFEKIAAAGALGNANFVSRGGTPGTTVQEHAIWALTAGVPKCAVSSANGGGASPSTTPGDCPSSISYPSWYHATGLTQGPNLTNASACNYPSDEGNCYVLTDRGTFKYLESTGALAQADAKKLQIVTRDNAPTSRGGSELLVNSFHAYAVNPAKFAGNPGVQINSAAAKAFLGWVTSPAAQRAVSRYLASAGDPPFIPSAAPALSSTSIPRIVRANHAFTVRGKIANVVPGTPPLGGVRVRLRFVRSTSLLNPPVTVASAATTADGRFAITYTPVANGSYSLAVPGITKIEKPALSPVFGDLLTATGRSLGSSRVTGVPAIASTSVTRHYVTIKGRLYPRVFGSRGTLSIYAEHLDRRRRSYVRVAQGALVNGQVSFTARFRLGSGRFAVRVRYVNPDVIDPGYSVARTVRVN